jgi:hypothetical protein
MRSTKIIVSLFILLLCISANQRLVAQSSASENQAEKFKFSFADRFRIETYDNPATLSKSKESGNSFIRNRISLTGQWFPDESVEVAAKITNEFRNYFAPSTNRIHMNELFFDQLYVKWNTKKCLDGVLTLGRQNITLGEGFVVMDGSPLDGSRSTYFNAFRYDWNINANHSMTLFYTYQPSIDKLPVINGNDIDPAYQGDGSWKLTEQTEAGGGIYYTGKIQDLNLQSYYIRKDYLKPDTKAGQIKSGINTIGSRLTMPLNNNFRSTLEGAYQFGKSGNFDKSAYGGYLYFDFTPKLEYNFIPKKITVGTVCLSGDDKSTKNDEGWDPIFSRWPKWSEVYTYTQIKEFNGRPAYWSNLISFYTSLQFTLDDQFGFNFDYHHMLAPQEAPVSAYPGGSGKVRGDLFIGKLLVNINKNVTTQIIIEHFIPGNYYFRNAAKCNWARMEFLYKI